ncbi:YihY family inner membrane protein [Inquilinus limosus]|uniref:YihY family inner membrane protein n=1 Tax=Inquilinus limosus TaxID=171674 RepID=UPI000690B173|nr:YihY family inner membrane protein [Inquilinus limosus]
MASGPGDRQEQSRSFGQKARSWAKAIYTFGRYAVLRFWNDRGAQAASALTYSSLLALVPIATIAFSILSAFPAFGVIKGAAQAWLVEMLVPEVGHTVLNYLEGFSQNTGRLTAFSIVGLVVSSVLLLATIEDAFNGIWRVKEQRAWLVRIVTFWAILTLTPILVVASFSFTINFFGSHGGGVAQQLWSPFIGFVPLVLQFIGFTFLYQLIPNKSVRWTDAVIGGAIAAVAFDLSKRLFAWYLREFPAYETIYGALATIPIFLLWLYLAWSIVLIGAVIAAALPDWRSGRLLGGEIDSILPGPRLTIAVAILRELAAASRLGVGLHRPTLVDRVPVGISALDGMLEQLRHARFVERSAADTWLISRDLRITTLADLMRGLGIGMRGKIGEVPGLEGDWLKALAERIHAAEEAHQDSLGVPLATVLVDEPQAERLPGRGEKPPIALHRMAPNAEGPP